MKPLKFPGFVLLEVAIALSVLGVIAYLAMPLMGMVQQWQQARLTHDHQEKILESPVLPKPPMEKQDAPVTMPARLALCPIKP